MNNELEKQIINNFQRDENMMILVFAQWCVNHDLNPEEIYLRAYPHQSRNAALQQALELTVPKEEAGEIPDETVLGVLSLFGNDDLVYVVAEEMKLARKS